MDDVQWHLRLHSDDVTWPERRPHTITEDSQTQPAGGAQQLGSDSDDHGFAGAGQW